MLNVSDEFLLINSAVVGYLFSRKLYHLERTKKKNDTNQEPASSPSPLLTHHLTSTLHDMTALLFSNLIVLLTVLSLSKSFSILSTDRVQKKTVK